MSTLVAALAVLGPDELGRARARQAFKASPHEVPGWLARLDQTSVDRAVQSTHAPDEAIGLPAGFLNGRLPGASRRR